MSANSLYFIELCDLNRTEVGVNDLLGRPLRNKSSNGMAFPHPRSRENHYRNDEKSNTGGVLWNFFKRAINITDYWNAKNDVNPADNRTFAGIFHD